MCSSSTPPVRGCWGLASRVPGLLAGTTSGDEIAFVDVVDTVREVHGYAKQAAAFGYTGQRGLNVRLATVCTPTAAPVIVRARLRRRDTASATGAGRLLAQAITTSRAAGATGPILARADSADDGWAVVGTALRHNVWFSVTGRTSAPVTRAIASIAERRGPRFGTRTRCGTTRNSAGSATQHDASAGAGDPRVPDPTHTPCLT